MTAKEWAEYIETYRHIPPENGPSSGQKVMLALALCNPAWLPDHYRQDEDDTARWRRLDIDQIQGILLWAKKQR